MVAFEAEVVNEDVPATVKAPVCVRLPTVSVIVRLPPTFDAPNTVALALVKLALPFVPLVLSDAAPVSRLPALVSVMVASVAEVVNDDVPPTVSAPLCVRLPTRSVITSFRPMLDAASVVATLFVRMASPLVPPVVLSAIAPFSALPVFVSVMVAFVAEVVNDEVPPTVRAPVCVRLPTVSVTVRLPPTFAGVMRAALALVGLALALAALVLSDAAPVSRLALVSAMVASVAEVVNEDVPVTVSTPLCVRLPSVLTTVRLPPTLDVPRTRPRARPLVRLAVPLAALVVSDTAQVSRLALLSVMVAFEAEVVNDDVPPTVSTPLCVRLPTESVTVRLPPTFTSPSTVALALVRLALPLVPLVLSDVAPVNRLALVSVMVAFEAEVVNDDVPPTVSTPFCVRLPTGLFTVMLPPTFEAPSTVAFALISCAWPLAPLVLSDAAPVSRLPALVSVMVASVAEVVNDDVPPTVSTPLCVRLPSVFTTVRLPPTLDVSRTRPLARLLVRLALPVAPVVSRDTAPLSALPALVSVMSAFKAEVVNDDVPPRSEERRVGK